MSNRIVHFEIHCPNIEQGVKFYQDVFGWKTQTWPGPEVYHLATTGTDSERGINGGLMPSRDGQPRTVNTIQVDNVDDAVKKVTAAGGKNVVPKMPIPGVGYLAYCTDPGGNIFGVMHPDENAK
jgi:uncharacterized protein